MNGSKLSSNFKLLSPNKMEMQLNLKISLKLIDLYSLVFSSSLNVVVVAASNIVLQNKCPEVCTLRNSSDPLEKFWADMLHRQRKLFLQFKGNRKFRRNIARAVVNSSLNNPRLAFASYFGGIFQVCGMEASRLVDLSITSHKY